MSIGIRPPAYGSLIDAARNSDLNGVKEWVEYGADVNAADAYGHMPLNTAVVNWANSSVIEYLLENKADVNQILKNEGTILKTAAFIGNLDAVKSLIKYGAKVDDTLLKYLHTQKADMSNVQGIVSNGMRPEILTYLEDILKSSNET